MVDVQAECTPTEIDTESDREEIDEEDGGDSLQQWLDNLDAPPKRQRIEDVEAFQSEFHQSRLPVEPENARMHVTQHLTNSIVPTAQHVPCTQLHLMNFEHEKFGIDDSVVDQFEAKTVDSHRLRWDFFWPSGTLATLIMIVNRIACMLPKQGCNHMYIGIARDPDQRWRRMGAVSHRHTWQNMFVLCACDALLARWFERRLIANFRKQASVTLTNRSVGGEHLNSESAFVYVCATFERGFDVDGQS